ncbi:MAG TPA: hypothetical protein VJH68_05320 [Candidatus Nanoarchaeia archaeon]|nr:hypothetical protein [Candidatus Nanoarchaeia archaeon]
MIDPFSVIGLVVIIILALSMGRILSYLLKFFYYTMIAALILVFLFGISWDELIAIMHGLLLLVF